MGIIDILQDYNLRKQLEHGIKSLQYDGVRVISFYLVHQTKNNNDNRFQDQISCVEPKVFASRFLRYMRDKLRSLPSSEMRTLSDLQQAASAMNDEPESFGMLTPRRQYHRRMQLELEGKVPPKEQPARPPPSPRFAIADTNGPEDLSSSDSSSSSSDDEPSSTSTASAASGTSGTSGTSNASGTSSGHKHRHHRRHHHHHNNNKHRHPDRTLLTPSPVNASPLGERRKEGNSKDKSEKSEQSDKSESKSEKSKGSESSSNNAKSK